MKTMKMLTLAMPASCAFGASAFADHQPGHPSPAPPKSSAQRTWNDQPVVVRTIGYPFVFLGRTGHTMIRSPQIVSETFRGDRTFLSKRGFFAKRDMDLPGERVASMPSQSIAN